eukprot:1053763-Lingulodinium_polyedra.AAC.1
MQAPRLPVIILAAMEVVVGDEQPPMAARVVARARLLKVYGSLRQGDIQRLAPQFLVSREAGLAA